MKDKTVLCLQTKLGKLMNGKANELDTEHKNYSVIYFTKER